MNARSKKEGWFAADLLRNAVLPAAAVALFLGAAQYFSTIICIEWSVSYHLWRWIYYGLFGGDEFMLYVVGTMSVMGAWFWLLCGVLLVIDITQWPAFITKYKVQPNKNVPLKIDAKLTRCLKVVLRNQLLFTMPFQVAAYYLASLRGCQSSPETMPDFTRVVFDLVCITLAQEVMFYYSHLLMHQPYLYKRVHKQHHEWTAPIGIVAIYAHPLEHAMSNIGPVLTGPLIFGSHLCVVWLWLLLGIGVTVFDHSGYHFPLLKSSEFHDYHHLKFNNNFGLLGILDWLHGTDAHFRQSRAYERHRVLLSTTPLSVQIPDETPAKLDE